MLAQIAINEQADIVFGLCVPALGFRRPLVLSCPSLLHRPYRSSCHAERALPIGSS